MTELQSLYQEALQVFASDDLSWEDKYDRIFSESLSRRVFDLIRLDYCDPDTSYEEDVTAFVFALRLYMDEHPGA